MSVLEDVRADLGSTAGILDRLTEFRRDLPERYGI